jgi:hemerythrin superfamily protein
VCKVYFRRLINTDEIDISNFENTSIKQIIKRDHSKWAIMKSELTISMDALDMLASMANNLETIQYTKINDE